MTLIEKLHLHAAIEDAARKHMRQYMTANANKNRMVPKVADEHGVIWLNSTEKHSCYVGCVCHLVMDF